MAVIGIDLGTTNSLGAYWKDGRVQLIPMEGESFLLPSVVGYVEGEGFLAGAEAKERLMASSIPCIVPRGRKGGSNVAAAIFNALLYDVAGR